MRIIGSLTSPYVRKVRIFLAEKHIDYIFDVAIPWDTNNQTPNRNPLGQVRDINHG